MADTRSLAGAMLTGQTAGRSLGSLNPSAREARTGAYAPPVAYRQNGKRPCPGFGSGQGQRRHRELSRIEVRRSDEDRRYTITTAPHRTGAEMNFDALLWDEDDAADELGRALDYIADYGGNPDAASPEWLAGWLAAVSLYRVDGGRSFAARWGRPR